VERTGNCAVQVNLAGKFNKNAFQNTKITKDLLEFGNTMFGRALGDLEKSISLDSKAVLFFSFDICILTRVMGHTGCAKSNCYLKKERKNPGVANHSSHFRPLKCK
jgi:hypothetical protein